MRTVHTGSASQAIVDLLTISRHRVDHRDINSMLKQIK